MASGFEKSPDYGGPEPNFGGGVPVAIGILALAILAAVTLWSTGAFGATIIVTDGDTILVDGKRVRLVGFNAPETRNARCELERELGNRATARLKQLVAGGGIAFEMVACACRPGTEGTDRCNYGRACGTLRVVGRDVGDILITEGLAVPFICGATRCPPDAAAMVSVMALRPMNQDEKLDALRTIIAESERLKNLAHNAGCDLLASSWSSYCTRRAPS